jgi:hypothetical protein
MKKIAADMGADGLIGIHWNDNGQALNGHQFFRSGLAVRWLAPGEAKRELAVPFVVAILPIQDQSSPGKESKISESLRESVMYPLETKGYYVLPVKLSDFKGSIEKAKSLSDAELRAVGGEDAQLLFGLTIEASANTTIVVQSGSTFTIKTALLDKQSRSIVFENVGVGYSSVGWLANAIMPNEKRDMAATAAAGSALVNLPAINVKDSN